MRRFLTTFGLIAAVLAAVPSVSAAGTLVGETFSTTHVEAGANCTTPDTGTIDYTADQGTAVGPHVGPFVEHGTIVMTAGVITSWDVTFTIFDPLDTVTGTKSLVGPATGHCSNPAFDTSLGNATGALSYNATFAADDSTETGPSVANLNFTHLPNDAISGTFTETFGPSTPTTPTTKDDCKNGRWRNYPMFKNQGDCIAFVNHMP